MKNVFKNFFSVDEQKVSTLVIAFIGTLITALVMYVMRKDISANLTNILITFICAIGGINLPNGVAGVISALNTSASNTTTTTNTTNETEDGNGNA